MSFIRVGAGSETLSPVETARAQELAFGFLHGDPDRWQHVQGVAVRAAELRPAVPATDGSLAGFPFAEDALTDALTYADQTVGPRGERLAVADRLAEAVRRHGPDAPSSRAAPRRDPYIYAAAERTEARL